MTGTTGSGLLDVLRRHCEEMIGAEAEFPFGDTAEVYKVGDRMFAIFSLDRDPVSVRLKLPPELGAEYRDVYPDTVSPGPNRNKPLWNEIQLTGSPDAGELIELVDAAHELVWSSLPCRVRKTLSG